MWVQLTRWFGFGKTMLIHHLVHLFALERKLVREQLVSHDGQRVLIRSRDRLTLPLFGRHIARCSSRPKVGGIANGTAAHTGNAKVGKEQVGMALSLYMCT